MTREHVLIVLGALVLLSPWSGIPMEWLKWALLLIGAAVVAIALSIRTRVRGTDLPELPQTEPQSRSSHIAFS